MMHLMELPAATKTYRPGRWAQVEDPDGVNMLDFVEGASSGLISAPDPGRVPATVGIVFSSASLSLPSWLLLSSACGAGDAEKLRVREVFLSAVEDEASTSELASTIESIANRFSVGTGPGEGYVDGVPSSLTTTSP